MDIAVERGYNVSKDYLSEKFPTSYQKFLMDSYKPQEVFANECLQKIYHSGRLPGTRLLDFGSGPTVHRVASASLQYTDIVLSEWSELNRREIEKWLKGDKDAIDWTSSLEQCARAEGFRDLDEGVAEITRRIRKAVKKVVPCDILSENILPEGLGEFDAINTCYCLEACCFTSEVFTNALRKLTKYLKSGGALVMVSVLRIKEYEVHKVLEGAYLTEDSIKEALNEVGLELKDSFLWRDSKKYENLNYEGVMVYYSIKP